MHDGSRKTMPMLGSWFSEIFGGFYFSQPYCALCDDVLADYADIAFADAYLPEVMKADKTGTSIMIGRTEAGQSLIEQARAAKLVVANDLAANRALASQWFVTLYKKRNLPARVRMLSWFGRSIPISLKGRKEGFLRPTAWDYLTALVPCLNIRISGNRTGRWILRRMPLGLLIFLRKSYKWLLMRQSNSLLGDR
jgi:hypothetical protein